MRQLQRLFKGRGRQQLKPLAQIIAGLFKGGTPGAWYDPSDMATLFQDSAGTTPVTAVEQPVGLMLDKSQGLVLGPQLVTNGDFTSASGWTAGTGWTISGGLAAFSNPTGTSLFRTDLPTIPAGRWCKLEFNMVSTSASTCTVGLNIGGGIDSFGSFTGSGQKTAYVLTTVARSGLSITGVGASVFSIDNISVKELPGNHAFQSTAASRPVLSARVNKLLATATLATQSVTTRATAHTLRFEGAGTVTLTGTAIGVYTAGTHSITTTAGTLTLTVLGSVTSADLRETNDGVGLPVYQAVVTSSNYTTTGFLPYLKFDGIDDSMSTNSINFTSTDKMSVFAGVRKLSDATAQILYELSFNINSNNGTFNSVPGSSGIGSSVGAYWIVSSKGTTIQGAVTTATFPAPATAVQTQQSYISGDVATLRVNGAQVAQNTGDQGTGNYGNYPIFIGRRGGSSLPFNGQMYSMIIVGKAVQAGELSSSEKYTAAKTGVTL